MGPARIFILNGFLGSGKTTFLQKFITNFKGQNIYVVMNEFGKKDVDSKLIASKSVSIKSIYNGSIFCTCKSEQFIDTLAAVLGQKPDVIVIESSGLADPKSIPSIFNIVKKLAKEQFEIGCCIGIMDAVTLPKVITTAVMIPQQIAASHFLLLNKVDLVSKETIENCVELLRKYNDEAPIIPTTYSKIPDMIRDKMINFSRPLRESNIPQRYMIGTQNKVIEFQKPISLTAILGVLDKIKKLVYRVKGFVETKDGWYFIEYASEQVSYIPIDLKDERSSIVILGSGQHSILPVFIEEWQKNSDVSINVK